MQYTLAALVKDLDVTLQGDPTCLVSGVCTIQQSRPGYITFLINPLYRKYLPKTQAAAVILAENDAGACPVNAVIARNPYYVYSKIAAFFTKQPAFSQGMHPSVVVGKETHIDPSVSIAPHCVIGARVHIGPHVTIGAGCVIGNDVQIGEASQLAPRVTLYDKVTIGKRVIIASGVVIGGDGFGFANEKGVWHSVPQLGGVDIGDDVSIGANTNIACGAVENTVIEHGVKLDSLIQVGHNVKIGANTIIAGCVAIAGSAVIGKQCMIGGASNVAGHVTLCDGAVITGMSAVSNSIQQPGIYSSGIVGMVPHLEFRKNNARFHRLAQLIQRVKVLETRVKETIERVTERAKS